ncbi:hypothetical protein JVU11DRAFT_10473 [Chiua virens]|nr:hypothetical protein JVU11DRAFT_10473 [Chiua virens]
MQKGQGGHTLPCRFTLSTPRNPAKSGLVHTSLTQAQSSVVFSSCRLHNITFGNAYFVLAQVAMTRVLYRLYLRGGISEEEWDYRIRQPHITYGPFNLRPYLDKGWFEDGGGGEFMNATSYLLYQLPFMTLSAAMKRRHDSKRGLRLSNGAPPFSDLLTFDRFLYRARLVKKQAAAFFGHPLFFEIACATYNPLKVESLRLAALEWMRRVQTRDSPDSKAENVEQDEVLAVQDRPVVFAHTGSSFGNMDPILPSEYPLPPSHPLSPYSLLPHPAKAGYVTPPPLSSSASAADLTPTIMLEDWTERIHHRPGGAYLGASTWRGRLKMFAHYDGNVLEEGLVREWVRKSRKLCCGISVGYIRRVRMNTPRAQQRYKLDCETKTYH